MEWLYPLLQAVQVISALAVIGLVLLQHGKGADMGSAFGAGSAGSLFGAAGAANFLSRTTRWAAIVFFISTAGLAWAVYHPKQSIQESGSIMSGYESVVPGQAGVEAQNPVPPAPEVDPSIPTLPQNSSSIESSAVPTVPAVPVAPDASSVPQAPQASGHSPSAKQGVEQDSGQGSGQESKDSNQDAKADRAAGVATPEAESAPRDNATKE